MEIKHYLCTASIFLVANCATAALLTTVPVHAAAVYCATSLLVNKVASEIIDKTFFHSSTSHEHWVLGYIAYAYAYVGLPYQLADRVTSFMPGLVYASIVLNITPIVTALALGELHKYIYGASAKSVI